MSSYSGFGKEIIPYPGMFIAYALGAFLMGLNEKLAVAGFSVAFLGSVMGSFAAARRLNHAE